MFSAAKKMPGSGFDCPTSEELMMWSESSRIFSRWRSDNNLDVALVTSTSWAFFRQDRRIPKASQSTVPGETDQSSTASFTLASGNSRSSRSAILFRYSSSKNRPVTTKGRRSLENAALCVSGGQIRITPSRSDKIALVNGLVCNFLSLFTWGIRPCISLYLFKLPKRPRS